MIIATWNARDALAACLSSIAEQELDGPLETIVVDNASTDGTDELLRERQATVTAIQNEDNIGYCKGVNQGALAARGDILFIVNSDTVMRPGALQRLADALRDPRVGLAGPRYEWPDGSFQPGCSRDPTVPGALLIAVGAHHLLPDRLRARLAPRHWSHDRSRDVDVVMGAVLAVRSDVFADVGGLWPLMYASEHDLAWKVRQRGRSVRYVAGARVMHVGDYSNRQRYPPAGRAARVGRAELAFLAEHYPRWRAEAIRVVMGVAFAARAITLRLVGSPRGRYYGALTRAYAKGLAAGATSREAA